MVLTYQNKTMFKYISSYFKAISQLEFLVNHSLVSFEFID